jgi:biotin carboxyl carrier protein
VLHRKSLAWLGVAVLTTTPLAAQSGQPQLLPSRVGVTRVTLAPELPMQGTLFRVFVKPGTLGGRTVFAVNGECAGEPLHFEERDGVWWALAAVPISASGELTMPIVLEDGGPPDTLHATVRVRKGDYRMERLRVAPRFGRPPSAELRRRMADESARAHRVSRESQNVPRLWDQPFRLPRDSRVTSGFGEGREFNGRIESRHMGVDLAGAEGAPVRAMANGFVALTGHFYLGGNVVYIDHGAGLVSAYLHLSKILVKEGQAVSAGEVIGQVGATGRVTGPHLHWIVRYGRITVNGLSLPGLEPRDRGPS